MVKQYANGYFENGAWHRGKYENDLERVIDVDLRSIHTGAVKTWNGDSWKYAELTDAKTKCDDCPCIITTPDPSYKSLWFIGIGVVLFLILAFIIAML